MDCRSELLGLYRLLYRLFSNYDRQSCVSQREVCKLNFEGDAKSNVQEALQIYLPRSENISWDQRIAWDTMFGGL
jgi:hypothetical protein